MNMRSAENEQSVAGKPILTSDATKRRSRWLWLIALLVIGTIGGWISYGLYGSHETSLKKFDASEVARLETAMWRSYYNKERLLLFRQLAALMRTQYRMPYARSNVAAFRAAKAAFVFKEGHGRSDYEKALPDLMQYYSLIREMSDTGFDIEKVARLELEWWIIHRERKRYGRAALDRALAELPAALYQMPVERFTEHARLRAEAMLIRDDKAEAGGVSEADWRQIDDLLHQSWQSLAQAVN